ncbi:PIN domain-like protein [Mycena floridula]|nr:PIN domain-like protein [Mycena floridula]
MTGHFLPSPYRGTRSSLSAPLIIMGIKGLWEILAPASYKENMHEYAMVKGFIENKSGLRGLRVGIDASGWIYRAQFHHRSGGPLVAIYANVCKLLVMTVLPVFVFDGPQRPGVKRGKIVRGNPFAVERDFQTMLTALGLPFHIAPGEAEAEIAWLSQVHAIDLGWSDDSDSIVFGTTAVCRLDPEDKGDTNIVIYSAYNIAHHDDLMLSHEDLIFIALLAGGDYSNGISGCGTKTAVSIAQSGLGRELIIAARTLSDTTLAQFVPCWKRNFIQQLNTNSSGLLPRRFSTLTGLIPESFPEIQVLKLYTNPVTSAQKSNPTIPEPSWGCIDLLAIVQFADKLFSDADGSDLLDHLSHRIFPALAIRELIFMALSNDNHTVTSTITFYSLVYSILTERRSAQRGSMLELRVSIPVIDMLMIDALQNVIRPIVVRDWLNGDAKKIRAWIPFSLMEYVYPEAVEMYQIQGRGTLIRKSPRVIDLTELSDDEDENEMFEWSLVNRDAGPSNIVVHEDGVWEIM